mgnify:FL=1
MPRRANSRSIVSVGSSSGRVVIRSIARNFGLACVAAIFIGGCAPQTEVVKLYEDPTRAAHSYKRLLVVDLSSEHNQQQQFEDEIASQLRQVRVEAVPSYARLDASKGLLQDDINRLSDEVGADGILVTHIASVDTSVDMEKGREDLKSTCRRGDPVDYFLYDHEVLREPDSVKVAHTVIVITNQYDARSHDRIWTIQSTCFEKASIAETLLDEAQAIVRQLRIDELI